MVKKTTRRGFDEQDFRWFSESEVSKLKVAQEEVQWLLGRGYKLSSITDLVGGHYQFSARQRTALQRATASRLQCEKRKAAMLPLESYKEGCVYIDGFNLIITLEVALSGSVLILGNDGTLRDLAGLRGTYKIIDKTDKALELIGEAFRELQVSEAKFFIDSPVSNSGRLRNRILEYASSWNAAVDVELVPNADPILSTMERIVTSDSIILDECRSWLNFSRTIVEKYIKNAWVVNLSMEG